MPSDLQQRAVWRVSSAAMTCGAGQRLARPRAQIGQVADRRGHDLQRAARSGHYNPRLTPLRLRLCIAPDPARQREALQPMPVTAAPVPLLVILRCRSWRYRHDGLSEPRRARRAAALDGSRAGTRAGRRSGAARRASTRRLPRRTAAPSATAAAARGARLPRAQAHRGCRARAGGRPRGSWRRSRRAERALLVRGARPGARPDASRPPRELHAHAAAAGRAGRGALPRAAGARRRAAAGSRRGGVAAPATAARGGAAHRAAAADHRPRRGRCHQRARRFPDRLLPDARARATARAHLRHRDAGHRRSPRAGHACRARSSSWDR